MEKFEIDSLTVRDVKDIQSLLGGVKKSASPSQEISGGVRIVVLQRGWVVVGRFFQKGSQCRIENGHVIRSWGTTKGLGEIASGGPTLKTVLDASPTIRFHELTAVTSLDCAEDKWVEKCPRA